MKKYIRDAMWWIAIATGEACDQFLIETNTERRIIEGYDCSESYFSLDEIMSMWFEPYIEGKKWSWEYRIVPILSYIFHNPVEAVNFNLKDYISYEHEQDCCEHVYIDFDHLDSHIPEIIAKWTISRLEIYPVPGLGINVVLYKDNEPYIEWVHIFLACRNIQNWYYNNGLSLVFNWDTYDLRKYDCIDDSDGKTE